jgi:hypothetical protein
MGSSQRAVGVALQLATKTRTEGVKFRLFGSSAIFMKCIGGTDILTKNNRVIKDVDAVLPRYDVPKFRQLMKTWGWQEQLELTALTDGTRLRFIDFNDRMMVLDVAVDSLKFNQSLKLTGRFEIDWPTIPVTDLILSKLQIAKLSMNDLVDVAALLDRFNAVPSDEGEISLLRIEAICAHSWRWHRAVSQAYLNICQELSDRVVLSAEQADRINNRAWRINEAIRTAPKTLGWKLRSVVGDGMSWVTPVESSEVEFPPQP